MTLSPWFEVKYNGLPIRKGIYEWEIWMRRSPKYFYCMNVKAMFYPLTKTIILDGRIIEITKDDCWRGIVK